MSNNSSGRAISGGAKTATGFDKKIRLTHLLSILAIGVASLYTVIFYFLNFDTLSLFSLGIAIAFTICHFLNRYRFVNISRIALFLFANLFVFYLGSSLGLGAGINPLYFPLMGAIFILFDLHEYYKISFLFIVSFTLMIFGEATNYSLFIVQSVPPNIQYILSISTFLAAIVTSSICIYYLIVVNDAAEKNS